jgi:hypothetical protein
MGSTKGVGREAAPLGVPASLAVGSWLRHAIDRRHRRGCDIAATCVVTPR